MIPNTQAATNAAIVNQTPPPHMMSTPSMFQQPPQQPQPPLMYNRTQTPTYATPPAPTPTQTIQSKIQALPPDQQAMVMQVLSFTAEQIDALPPDQRMSILALVS